MAQYGTLDYLSCLQLLDTDKTAERTALSYAFRPLTKNKYAAKHNNTVNILAKGRNLFPEITPLISIGGGESGMKRINSISRVASLFAGLGIKSVGDAESTRPNCFIPSACWRKIRTGILSTTRFMGMLLIGNHRLAVYDIGDGLVEWQLRAEKSLFYIDFNEEFDTHATGMLFICDNDKRIDVAKRIIRETMWRRKQLIDYESNYNRNRPVKYTHSPIRLAAQYKKVYLTTPDTLLESLSDIISEDGYIKHLKGDNESCANEKIGDIEDYPNRYFVNMTTDLLKFVYFITEVKSCITYGGPVKYGIYLQREDIPILRMYPEIMRRENSFIYVCECSKNIESTCK